MKTFDVYAHHPYYAAPIESPTLRPDAEDASGAIQLGNINVLLNEITKLYGPKHLWITEYGYQTNPPDRDLRRQLREASGLADAGVLDREEEPAHRHDALVPDQGRAQPWRLAVRPRDGHWQEEAGLERVPEGPTRLTR